MSAMIQADEVGSRPQTAMCRAFYEDNLKF